MRRLTRLVRLGLDWAILLAVVWVALSTAVGLIARHNWLALLLWGMIWMLFVVIVRLALENQRLKRQIRELETGIGL